MTHTITERNYPIKNVWILKQILNSGFFILYICSFLILTLISNRTTWLGLIFLLLIPLHILYIYLQKINFHYEIQEDIICVKQGIISKQERNIPYGVIQHIIIKQTMLDKVFQFFTLVLENAADSSGQLGTSQGYRRETIGIVGSKIIIPGLNKKDTKTIRDILLSKMNDHQSDTYSGL